MWEKLKNSFWGNMVLLAVAGFLFYSAIQVVQGVFVLRGESQSARQKYENLQKKGVQLEADIAELQNPHAIEREAKERLNLKKAGEEVVVVVPEAPKSDSQNAKSFFEKLKSFFSQ